MKTSQIQEILAETLNESDLPDRIGIDEIFTFEELGLLTENDGLVFRMNDGSEFQMTIVKSH